MPHQSGVRTFSLALAVLAMGGCGKKDLDGPQAEVKKADIKVDLPAVPAFDLPPAPSDGSHTVKELRVKGKRMFGNDVTVHGYVTWAYDCMTAVRKPDESTKDAQKRIDEDPTLCERPKFYIGDSKDTPIEKSLWVVDVPRPYNKLELQRIEKRDRNDPLKCEPNERDPKKKICPPYEAGDEVTVTGTFAASSPHSERNSDGLLVYKTMQNATKSWASPDVPPAPGAPGTAPGPAGGKPSPEDLVHPKH